MALSFWELTLPGGKTAYIPDDIRVVLPEVAGIAPERLHLLAYIPWNEKYLEKVPAHYRDFFKFVVPHLAARTTDVHTALSVSYVPEILAATNKVVDEAVLYPAVILHDSGWAQLRPHHIADSLDYSALAYSSKALKPKEMHATLGAWMAEELLQEYDGGLGLSEAQEHLISELVYYHDQVRPWPAAPPPIEYLLLGDADRLWSYTHENFWLDTVRKDVAPAVYVQNLAGELEDFFLTEQGRAIARRLIALRKEEVASLPASIQAIAGNPMLAALTGV
jgi:hypothetical protein